MEKNEVFAAPLVGEELHKIHNQVYRRPKASQALITKQKQFESPVIKCKSATLGGPAVKKAKSTAVWSMALAQSARHSNPPVANDCLGPTVVGVARSPLRVGGWGVGAEGKPGNKTLSWPPTPSPP